MNGLLEPLLSVNEVARRLGIPTSQVYYIFKMKGFPAIHIGKRLYVHESALDSWLQACSTKE